MKAKFHANEVVRVRTDISEESKELFPFFVGSMEVYQGQKVTIEYVSEYEDNYIYGIEDCLYIFLEEWLEPVK